MDEKILIQYRFADDPAYKTVKAVCLVMAIIFAAMGAMIFTVDIEGFAAMGGLIIGCAVLLWVVVVIQGKMSITVTPNRVYGRTMLSEVSLPMDSVTMTRKSGMKNLRVESPSENFVFSLGNAKVRDEIYNVINQQISERQNNKGNVTVVNSASNADELKKYKDLLDAGIITQEEFDAKKKQLLGL